MQLTTKNGPVHIISAYAPTLTDDCDQKDKLYQDLSEVLTSIPAKDNIFILGDFNARVGADRHAWLTCLGQFGMGKVNENGQRLLEFCSDNSLSITNTFYNGNDRHKVSWRHPRSGHWHQIDFVITRRDTIGLVKSTRSYIYIYDISKKVKPSKGIEEMCKQLLREPVQGNTGSLRC